ncbi:MAG TPA: biopolymer transporter ExbD [Opitutae bacterium]|nr:biopolymer transporter TolR [Puniceicoccaceae bacterium]HCY58841.1 biopolymer transporter ExbD [Opitutae bacterium]
MKRTRTPRIDVVPLVDVLMVLIIFFLVTMQFQDLRALNVKLPQIDTAGSNLIKGQLVITVSKDGNFGLNGNESHKDEISTVMIEVAKTSPDVQVLIAADEDSPLKFITEVVDLCRESGLDNFRLQSR